jgi:hypothetical protein
MYSIIKQTLSRVIQKVTLDNWLENNYVFLNVTVHLPALTTACVWAEVPEAIFVKAQAASNCKFALEL